MRKIIFAVVVLFAAAGLLFGADPAWKKDTSPVTLDWYINFSWYKYDWGSTMISKYIKEKTGVTINFIIPAGNEAEKLNTMIASGTLPDLVTLGWWEEGVKKMVEGQLVYSLDELAQKYDPAFFSIANSQLLGWYKQADGKTYGYPNFAVTPSDFPKTRVTSNQTFLVRTDMYEAIGKPNMRTPNGFLAALKAAKDKFPTVNGQPIIPFGAHEFTDTGNYSFDEYLQNFLAVPMEKNGKVYDRREDPELVKWLKTFRKANEMGLISPDIFIDKRAQMEEKIAQGRYFSMMFQRTDMVAGQQALWAKNPKTAYMAVDGPANSKGDKPKLKGPAISGWTLTLVSKNAKKPDRAISFMTYWISDEGQKDFYLGKKEETWDTINGKDQYLPKYAEMKNSNREEHDRIVGQDPLWMLGNSLIQQAWAPPTSPSLKQMEDWTEDKCISFSAYNDLDPAADSDLGIVLKKVNDNWGRALPKLLLAKSDAELDKLYADFMKQRDALGWSKVVDYQNASFAKNKAKLGMK
jgi:putative aldouronate transport system substrate-binding protein